MSDKVNDAIDGLRHKMIDKINKTESRIAVSMYIPEEEVHSEGEEWVDDNGKHWKQENGKKISVNPYQGAKLPWFCPKCQGLMNHYLHEQMYWKRGMCFNCVVRMEGKIRMAGEWEKYDNWCVKNNEISFLKDAIIELEDYKKSFDKKTSFVLSSGELQKWNITRAGDLQASIQVKIDEAKVRLTEIEKEVNESGFDINKYKE